MNRLLSMSLVSLSLLTLNGCNDKDSKQTNASYKAGANTASCTAFGNPINSFQRIQMHYGLLSDGAFISGETGGLLPLSVTADALAGSTTIHVDSTTALVPGQLITYLGENFDYYVAQIASLTETTITLTEDTAVVSTIAAGNNAWNFYDEASKPNQYGYNALADLSYRGAASTINANTTHVLIGDDWLYDSDFTHRLAARYSGSGFINHTGSNNALCDLLANFDRNVTAYNPQYVWISSSVNDNHLGVSQEDYKLRLQDLIAKVQGIGATAIVFDAVPGSEDTSSTGAVTAQTLAHRYSTQIFDLYGDTGNTEPVVVTPPTNDEEDEQEPIVIAPPTHDNSTCSTDVAQPITSFTRVNMHWGLLRSQGFVSSDTELGLSETEGLQSYNVSTPQEHGANTIQLDSTSGLVTGQLLTYLANDGIYRVAQIESLTPTQITTTAESAVIGGIAAGENLWNFYYDPNHPNLVGARAIADFGLAITSGLPDVNEGTHVLLGDSWFTTDGFEERFISRLPDATIINQSTGGQTVCDLLEKFDSDVAGTNPDFVWINSSVNDYFSNVSQSDFKIRMQNLIAKVQSTGAVAVVYDSAPAPNGTMSDGTPYNTLSQQYAFQVEALLGEANN